MTKFGPINFDDRILDALRDDKLVVFAGAGVSMGPPSNLASFWKLTCEIAQGTGHNPEEPPDRFLGKLHHHGIKVHERASQLLSPAGSAPNQLHQDLVRLFPSAEKVRLITTNFDLHFETAASKLFGTTPDIYRAPALPLGYDFSGIVYIHGALHRTRDLVLTDADFGRAYLTEGWARRFLVDVFREYTVLFVGYSHNDVVMNYLARSLPADSVAGRFALTDEDGNWDLLGIKPIKFNKGTSANTYKELYEGVQRLAERTLRGASDWQNRMSEIGSRSPPVDEEAISEVEQALREVRTTRFLTNVARSNEWPMWLNARRHLEGLFDSVELSERDKLLALWLAEHFAIEHANTVFELVIAHGLRLNPLFWWRIGRELSLNQTKPLDETTLKRWVTILLASAPSQADPLILMLLAKCCARHNAALLTLKVFLKMSEHQLNVKPRSRWGEDENQEQGLLIDIECTPLANHSSLEEVWTEHMKPQLGSVAQHLMIGITQRLENIHNELLAWEQASSGWDLDSYHRSAIEPHEQDQHPNAVDVLIDSVRDTLEWLGANEHLILETWMLRLAISNVPLLRRLGIHAINIHPSMSANDRLNWLLDHVGLHGISEHHEVYRVVELNYAKASETVRKFVVDAICVHQLPATEDRSSEERTARLHFEWLSWLFRAKPDCLLAKTALEPIKATYSEWQLSENQDFTHWIGLSDWVESKSPWSIEQLLDRTPSEQLEDLLNFQGNWTDNPDRSGLLITIRETCKQKPKWAFDLAEALSDKSEWKSDLWSAIIQGLQESEMPQEEWLTLLNISSKPELLSHHARDIANLLYELVRDGGKPFAIKLLEQANVNALLLWHALEAKAQDNEINDWLFQAINQPAGVIVEFWINGLSLLMRDKKGTQRTLPDNYKAWFTIVVQDDTSKGGLGRSVLASQTASLFNLDETWTQKHLIPLFSDSDPHKFEQAWDGFLVGGRLYPTLIDALMPALISALGQMNVENNKRRNRFIEFYTGLSVLHVADPRVELLPALFRFATIEDRRSFAYYLGYILRRMEQVNKTQIWDTWLQAYWLDRLQGVHGPLNDAEIQTMLEWLPHLGDIFPKAALLAAHALTTQITHSQLLPYLQSNDLVIQYQSETAELLIYLCKCIVGYHVRDLKEIALRLTMLEPTLRHRLNEALASTG